MALTFKKEKEFQQISKMQEVLIMVIKFRIKFKRNCVFYILVEFKSNFKKVGVNIELLFPTFNM